MARAPRWVRFGAMAALLSLLAFAGGDEGALTTGCLPAQGAAACASCHPRDAATRWAADPFRPCTPYCLTCHTKDQMDRHHHVGTPLSQPPRAELPLTAARQVACFTCHLLSRPRYDTVRWKAASLYDRMFRSEPRYKTYFLAIRNDQGQLCLACH